MPVLVSLWLYALVVTSSLFVAVVVTQSVWRRLRAVVAALRSSTEVVTPTRRTA